MWQSSYLTKTIRSYKSTGRVIAWSCTLALGRTSWKIIWESQEAIIFRSMSSILWCIKVNCNSSGCIQFWIRNCIISRRKDCGVCMKIIYKGREELCNYWKRIPVSPVWLWKILSICFWEQDIHWYSLKILSSNINEGIKAVLFFNRRKWEQKKVLGPN